MQSFGYVASTDPGGFQAGASLAGNDSSELSSTMSSGFDGRGAPRLRGHKNRIAKPSPAIASTQLRPLGIFDDRNFILSPGMTQAIRYIS